MLRCAGGWRAGECCTRRGKQKTAGNGERRCDVFHVILPVWTMVTADECAIPAGAKAGCTVPNKTVISASRDCPIDADVDRRYGMSNAGQDGRASVERRFLRTNINFESVDLTFSADETDHRHRRPLRVRRERPYRRATEQRDELATPHVWMAPAWQEIIWRAAQRSLAVMCPACWCSPGGLLALMGSANRVLIIQTGSMSR